MGAATDGIVWDDVPAQSPDAGIVWDSPPATQKPEGLLSRSLGALTDTLSGVGHVALAIPRTVVSSGLDLAQYGLNDKNPRGQALIASLERGKKAVTDTSEMFDTPNIHAEMGALARGAGKAINRVGDAAHRGLNAAVGQPAGDSIVDAAGEIARPVGDVLGLTPGLLAARGAAESATASTGRTAATAVARTPIEQAEAAGLKILPSSVKNTTGAGAAPSLLARAAETGAGSGRVAAKFSQANKPVWNNIVAQDIGLKSNSPLTKDTIAQAEKPHAAVYAEVKKVVPTTAPDEQLLADLTKAGRGTDSVRALPASIDKEREALLQPMNGSQMLDTISDLRQKGYKGMLAVENPDTEALGHAQVDLADALESHLDRQVQRNAPELAGAYQDARKGFAKIEAAKSALVNNDVNPAALAKLNKRRGTLDGGLKVIADTASYFPDSMQLKLPKSTGLERALTVLKGGASFGAIPAVEGMLTKALSATRGVAKKPLLGESGPLGYNYRGRTPFPQKPLELTPSPGSVYEPHQHSLFAGGDTGPIREQGGLPPHPDLTAPPGPVYDPAQYDWLTMMAQKLRDDK